MLFYLSYRSKTITIYFVCGVFIVERPIFQLEIGKNRSGSFPVELILNPKNNSSIRIEVDIRSLRCTTPRRNERSKKKNVCYGNFSVG